MCGRVLIFCWFVGQILHFKMMLNWQENWSNACKHNPKKITMCHSEIASLWAEYAYRAQAWVGNYIKTNHQKNLGISYRIVGLLWLFRQMLLGVYSQQEMSKLWLSNSPPVENASYSFVFLPFLRFTRCVHSWNIRLQNSPLYVKPT